MPLYRAQVTLPFFTAVPEDVATNTLYFQTPEGTSEATALSAIDVRLDAFYAVMNGLWSKVVIAPGTYKVYDMADPTPRTPVGLGTVPLVFTPAALNMPEETAMCLSFQAAPVSGASQARRRGRIYLGPLSLNATTQPSGAGFVQWASAVRTTVSNGAAAMANTTTNAATWVVYSPTNGTAHPVANGWIDNQPDTQRRRGHKTVGRTLWAAP